MIIILITKILILCYLTIMVKNNLGTVFGTCEGAMLSTLVDTSIIF